MSTALRSVTGEAALALAARDVFVFPLHGVREARCTCGRGDCARPGKHPRIPKHQGGNGYKDATVDATHIRSWWSRWPDANVGCALEPSRLVVVDIDRHDGGADGFLGLEDLQTEHGPLPDTVVVATGGGGRHHYYRRPPGDLRHVTLAPGVELLTTSVTMPPSVTGGAYRYTSSVPLAWLPRWLVRRARRAPPRAPSRAARGVIGDHYARVAVERECEAVRRARNGRRNETLIRAAFSVGTLVGAGALSQEAAVAALSDAAAACGLPSREAGATIQSGLRAGGDRPRALPRDRRRR